MRRREGWEKHTWKGQRLKSYLYTKATPWCTAYLVLILVINLSDLQLLHEQCQALWRFVPRGQMHGRLALVVLLLAVSTLVQKQFQAPEVALKRRKTYKLKQYG